MTLPPGIATKIVTMPNTISASSNQNSVRAQVEDRDDAEHDQREQRPEQRARPGGEVSARRVAVGAEAADEQGGRTGRLVDDARVRIRVVVHDRTDEQAEQEPQPEQQRDRQPLGTRDGEPDPERARERTDEEAES